MVEVVGRIHAAGKATVVGGNAPTNTAGRAALARLVGAVRRPEHKPVDTAPAVRDALLMKQRRRFYAAFSMLLVLLAVGAAISAAADALPHAVEQQIRAHERLHYGLHLAAGRILRLCPCTRAAAQSQYAKAQPHAHTPRQRALVTTQVPQTTADYATDALLLVRLGLRAGMAHPAGQRLLIGMSVATGLLVAVLALRRLQRLGRPLR